jgi:hypothetical protein
MPLSLYALDKFVAQELSQLTECKAAPIAPEFPNHSDWLRSFVLNCTLGFPVPKDKAALAFALIRRAQGAIDDYEDARSQLDVLVASKVRISIYFHCLRRFESAVAMVSQALDFCRKATGIVLFVRGDNSPYERLRMIYNRGRHCDPQTLPGGQLHTVWIKNDGLYTT